MAAQNIQMTRGENIAAGCSRRRQVPLESHAEIPSSEQPRDAVALLTDQDRTRLRALVPIRHGRMSATPFTFYRGAAAIMASDLSSTAASELQVQLCGDAHLSNFGLFNGPDRRLVFDLNDFDETLPGPFEWDLKRLATSVTIAARASGLDDAKTASATRAAVRGYRETMGKAAKMSPIDLHYLRLSVDALVENAGAKDAKRAARSEKRAARKNHMRAFTKLTEMQEGRRRIVSDPPLITRLDSPIDEETLEHMLLFFNGYLETLPVHRRLVLDRYRLVDIAHKVVGVGSVGTRCYIVLLVSPDKDPLFLQFKEATSSVLEAYLGASEYAQAGERVVRGQRLMQSASDIFLGWSRHHEPGIGPIDYYFRQLWDGKGSLDVGELGPKRLKKYAYHCGGALALGHARSGNPSMIFGYVGQGKDLDHAVAEFAEAYADLNDSDYEAHAQAIADGRIDAVRDV